MMLVGSGFDGLLAADWVIYGFYLAAVGFSIYSAVRGQSTQEIETTGPRIEDNKLTVSTLGTPKPVGYGTVRLSGNIIWAGDLEEEIVETEVPQSGSGGGKGGFGGGGGVTTATTMYLYYRSVAIAFAEGTEDNQIIKLFANGKLVFNRDSDTDPMYEEDVQLRWHTGSTTQDVDPLIEADVGTDNCPAYRGTCYAVLERFPLADFGNALPNFSAVIAFNPDPVYPWEWMEPYPTVGPGDWTYDPVDNVIYGWHHISFYRGKIQRIDLNTNTLTESEDLYDSYPEAGFAWPKMLPMSRVLFLHNSHYFFLIDSETFEVIESVEHPQNFSGDYGICVYADLEEGAEYIILPCDRLIYGLKVTNVDGYPRFAEIGGSWPSSQFPLFWYMLWDGDGDRWHVVSHPPGWDSQQITLRIHDVVVDRDGSWWCVGGVQDFTTYPEELGCLWKLEIVEMLVTLEPAGQGIGREEWRETAFYWIGYPGGTWPYPPDPVPDYGWDVTGSWGYFTNVCYNAELHQLIIRQKSNAGTTPNVARLFCWDIETESIVWNRHEDDLGVGYDDDGWGGGGQFPSADANPINFKNPWQGDLWLFQGRDDTHAGWMPAQPIWQVRMSDGAIIKIHDRDPFGEQITPYEYDSFYHGPTHSFINFEHTDDDAVWRGYLDRATGEGVGLDTVVSDICVRAGLSTDDIDVTDLSIIADSKNLVRGFRLTRRTSARAAIETLSKGYFFDAVESDFKLKFLRREDGDRDTLETIPEDDLGVGIDAPAGHFVEEERAQDEEIPVQYDIRFINPDIDWQEDSALAQRILSPIAHVTSQSEQAADLPIVFTSTEARRVAERWLATAWTERVGLNLSLLPKWLRADPTDIFTVLANSVSRSVRVLGVRVGESFDVQADVVVVDQESYAETDSEGAVIEFTPQEIGVISSSYLFVLDIPLLQDAHDSSTVIPVYLAVTSVYAADWPGGVALKSYDLNSWTQLGAFTSDAAYGRATEVLGDWTSGGLDTVNTVQIQLQHTGFSLTSVTETEMLNGANPAMLGGELLQFQNATDLGDGLWELDTFMRGRRGSEWATGTHIGGDRFLFLTTGTVSLHQAPLEDLNAVRHYRGVSLGKSLTSGHLVSLASTGVPLKPYAPSYVGVVRDGTAKNIHVYWTRRSRLGGEIDWTQAVEVPLGEAVEAYEVDLLDKDTGEVSATYSTTGSGSRQTSIAVTFSLWPGDILRATSGFIDESLYTAGKLVRVHGAKESGNNGTFQISSVTATQLNMLNANGVAGVDGVPTTKVFDQIGEQITISEDDVKDAGYTDMDDPIDVVVYQLNTVVGRGYGTSATL